MHINLEETISGRSFHAAVCVIGGGIAGLVLAMRLAKQGVQVHLLEAGGLKFEERSQALYQAEMSDDNHRGSNEGRFRTFGGSSTRWGGQILPFTNDIFQPPAGLPSEPWPITEQDLIPYYEDAQKILGVDPLSFSAELLSELGHEPLPASEDIDIRFSKWTPFKRRNLAKTLGVEALAHPNVTLFTHANAAALVTASGTRNRISSVDVLNYAREKFSFSADYFVVCAGTVESSRLLLCSSDVPNPHDQIGRYFHDHVAFHAARFLSPARERALESLGPFFVDGTTHTCKFEASLALREREGLLPVCSYIAIDEPEDSGALAMRSMLRSVQRGHFREGLRTNLVPMLRGGGDVARVLFYSRFKGRRTVTKQALLRLKVDVEQAPHPENRIRLSDSKTDALGLCTTIVQWRVNEPEMSTALRYASIMQDYLQGLELDPGDWSQSVVDHTLPAMFDTNHAMGGLRMGTDASRSVVNRELTVHGLENLHIASCAVFPSGSSSNPTFTMMALTLRLADHLVHELSGSAALQGIEAPVLT